MILKPWVSAAYCRRPCTIVIVWLQPLFCLFAIIRSIHFIWIILSGISPSSDIAAARFSPTQGSFRSVQLFGARTHRILWCAADILQPVSCKNILRQSPPGPCHDLAARNRPWIFCSVAGNSLVFPNIAPVLSLCWDRHWVQVLRMCTCVNDGNIRRSWKWL